MSIARLGLALALPICALPATGHCQNVAGGQSGYDQSLAAIEPTAEPITVGLAGEDPADIGRYLLAENGGVSEVRLSPDGQLVAFRWAVTGEPQLWVAPVEGGTPRRLTYGNGVTFFRWAPNGRQLLYGADNDGNEQPAFYVVQVDGQSEAMALPPAVGGFRQFGDFLPGGNAIAYASTERNGLDFDIYVADLRSGRDSVVYQGVFGYAAHRVSPDGRLLIVTESVGEDSDNLYLLDLASGGIEALSAPERRANHSGGGFAWVADGTGFYLASDVGREFAALMFYRVGAGLVVVEAMEHDVQNVTLCGPSDRYLAWTVNDGGYSRLFVRDRSRQRMLDTPELAEGVYTLDCQGNPARLAITVNGWRTPSSVFVWDLATAELHNTFTAALAGLDPNRLVRPESVEMPSRDGVQLQGLLYLPDTGSRRDDRPPPVVFLVHGGPTGQSRPSFNPIAQYHVDRGVAVFDPNVRGSTGFGHTYVTLDDRENRLSSVRDLVDMLQYLETDGRVDARRAAVVGGSYGGYMVNAVLANFPDNFVAGVSLYGVADWVTALEVASPSLRASDRVEYGDITEQRWRDYYRENSPIRQADRIRVPVLYSHGVMDPRIDISETETMVRTLRSNGIAAPFIRIPDEGHGWRRLSNRLFYYRRQADFLEEQFGITSPAN